MSVKCTSPVIGVRQPHQRRRPSNQPISREHWPTNSEESGKQVAKNKMLEARGNRRNRHRHGREALIQKRQANQPNRQPKKISCFHLRVACDFKEEAPGRKL